MTILPSNIPVYFASLFSFTFCFVLNARPSLPSKAPFFADLTGTLPGHRGGFMSGCLVSPGLLAIDRLTRRIYILLIGRALPTGSG